MQTDQGLRRSDGEVSRWVCFELDRQEYGLPIASVQEVLEGAQVEPVPGAGREVLGVINLRGNVVTVIDLRVRLGLAPRSSGMPLRIVIVDFNGEPIGLCVDRIADVRKVALAAVKPAPNIGAGAQAPQVHGVVARGGEMLTLLDVRSLMAAACFLN